MDGSLNSDWKFLFYAAVGFFSIQNAFQRGFLGAENDVISVLREFAIRVLGWLLPWLAQGSPREGLSNRRGRGE